MPPARAARAAQPQQPAARRLLPACALACLGLAAERAGGSAPFAFAAVLILGLGLPHGASDHLAALGGRRLRDAPGRLLAFLALYLGAVAAMLLFWHARPGAALAAFLALSALHFASDDVADGWRIAERAARGLMPVTLSALLHAELLAHLFATLSTPRGGAALAKVALLLAGPVLALAVLAAILRLAKGEHGPALELVLIAAALVLFPPLVGFALVFALVHSRGQTRARMAALGLPTLRAYLAACAPTLLGAAVLFGALAVALASGQAPALGALFIGLAALTVPHMLVTPLFARRVQGRQPA